MHDRRRDRPGRDVRGRTDLERDLSFDEMFDEPRVLDRSDPVADPIGEQVLERRPHALRSRPLAGVRRRSEPRVASPSEDVRVRRDLEPLRSGAVQRDDAGARELQRDLEGSFRLLHPVVADHVGLEPNDDAGLAFADGEAVQHRLDRAVPVAQPAGVLGGGEDDLRVTDALGGEVRTQLPRDSMEVVRLVQQIADAAVLVDEMEESIEAPRVVGLEGTGQRATVRVRELADRCRLDRALEVEVQLRLGEGAQVSHRPMVASRE